MSFELDNTININFTTYFKEEGFGIKIKKKKKDNLSKEKIIEILRQVQKRKKKKIHKYEREINHSH